MYLRNASFRILYRFPPWICSKEKTIVLYNYVRGDYMTAIEQGCIDIWIDEIVPCLKDIVTGDIKETVVFKNRKPHLP